MLCFLSCIIWYYNMLHCIVLYHNTLYYIEVCYIICPCIISNPIEYIAIYVKLYHNVMSYHIRSDQIILYLIVLYCILYFVFCILYFVFCIVMYCVLYCIMLQYIVLYHMISYYTILNHFKLFHSRYIILYYRISFYIILLCVLSHIYLYVS